MKITILTIIGLLIPLFGTTLGSSFIFFCKNVLKESNEKIFLGFAAGVMLAASIWSLIIPSIEMSKTCIPAVLGIILGVLFLLVMDKIIIKISKENKKGRMLGIAITLHNIPEGMAVGVSFALAINSGNEIAFASALAIALGIAIQNIPEGMAISLPYRASGMSKIRSFIIGSLSGIVEPIAAIITLLISGLIIKILPMLLAFAAGSMIYVVIKELVPESQKGQFSDFGLIGNIIGFILMMVLDILLG